MDQVQKTEMVRDFIAKLKATSMCLAGMFCIFSNSFFFSESDREDGSYCPPVKRERTSSLTQFPPSQSGKCFYSIIYEGWFSFLGILFPVM